MHKIQLENIFTVNNSSVNLDFSVHYNKINLLQGNNGIGKTTFFEYLKTSDLFDSDRVFMDQFPLCPISDYSVQNIIQIISEEVDKTYDIEQVEEKYQIQIKDLLEKKVSYLSGGEQQRMKFFLTLMQDRKIFFLDEPFQYLDQATTDIFLKALNTLLSEAKLVFLIEHRYEKLLNENVHKVLMQKNDDLIEVKDGI